MRKKWAARSEGWSEEKRSFVRYALVALLAFVVWVGFVSRGSVLRWIKAGFQLQSQERLIRGIEADIRQMESRGSSLSENKDSLEKYARETFFFAAPGEDVYVVEP